MEYLVIGIQMMVEQEPERNYVRMRNWMKRVKFLYPGARIVVFPELAYTGAVHPGLREEEVMERFSPLAEENGIWLVPGSFYINTKQGKVNRAYLFSPEGKVEGYYDKIFPWAPYEDSLPGKETRVFQVEGLRIGIEICYDIWFPQVALSMVEQGVDLIINPVMTTTADRSGEEVLVRATAIFTQSYLLSVNGLGKGGVGNSLAVGPEGEVITEAGQAEVALPLLISTERLRQVREMGSFGSNKILKEYLKRREK